MPNHRKSGSLDRVLGRLDNLDKVNLTNLVQRLARDRGLLEAVFNSILEGIVIIDPDGVIQYANEAAVSMIGIKEGDIGKAILWRLVPDLNRILEVDLEGETHPPPSVNEVELTYPENRYVRAYLTPFHEEMPGEEVSSRYAVILTDITKEKQSTEEYVESEKVSSILLLAAGVAHELGNPLNSLTIHLQLMRRRLARLDKGVDTSGIRESLDICEGEVSRLNGIVTHFLEAVRPAPPELKPVNLIRILEEVLEFQATELDNLSIKVDIELNEELPVVMADPSQVKQVFFNLIKNAMDAMGKDGRLRIRARSDDDYVYLHLGDSGPGIPREDLGKVFQPYFTRKSGGHGLGLMIVQRIMRDHGGQVAIESEEKVGTVVSLQFPQQHRRVRMLEG